MVLSFDPPGGKKVRKEAAAHSSSGSAFAIYEKIIGIQHGERPTRDDYAGAPLQMNLERFVCRGG